MLGLQYRNRVATFIARMSSQPHHVQPYKSNPVHRAVAAAATQDAVDQKLTTFAIDPTATRTGMIFKAREDRIGDSIIHNGSVGKHVSYRKCALFEGIYFLQPTKFHSQEKSHKFCTG